MEVTSAGAGAPRDASRQFRGPFSRWPRTADAVLALLHLGFVTLLTEGPGDTMVRRDLADVPVWVLLVFAAASAALYWRRTHPLHVAAAGVASMAVLLGSGFADTGGVAILGLYAAGRHADSESGGRAATVAAAIFFVLDGITDDLPWFEVAVTLAFTVGAWLLGRSRRMRDERAVLDLREREADRRRVVAEERTRIARELHDVVAHRVSLMTVQAAAAAAVADRDPVAARRAMEQVEDAGRQALDELRHLLGVLRPDIDGASRDPQPGLADLPRLVERVRAAGPTVELTTSGMPGDLPSAMELAAHRIVQESLTNVLKHAGESARVTVDLHAAGDVLVVEVANDHVVGAPHGPEDASSRGHGIPGMRERATLLGGSLEAGPTADGGFRVRAELPIWPGGHESHQEGAR